MKQLAIRSTLTLVFAWLLVGAGVANAATQFPVNITKVAPAPAAPDQTVNFEAKATWNKAVKWAWNWNFDEQDATHGWDAQATSSKPTHRFARGNYTVAAFAYDADDNWGYGTFKNLKVGRAPQSSFTIDPSAALLGQPVNFTSTSASPDQGGQIVSYAWTVDGQDAGTASTAGSTFTSEGEHTAILTVTDELGFTGTHQETFVVTAPAQPQPEQTGGGGFDTPNPDAGGGGQTNPLNPAAGLSQFKPKPFIRIKGHTTGKGAQIDLFSVRAARGAKVWVRCVGKACPKKRSQALAVKTKKKVATVRFRRIQGWFRAGTVIEVRVTKKGYIGRYTRYRIGKLKPPVRWDGCLIPGAKGPKDC